RGVLFLRGCGVPPLRSAKPPVTARDAVGGRAAAPRALRKDVSRIAALVVILLIMVAALSVFWLWLTATGGGQDMLVAFAALSVVGLSAAAAAAVIILARRVLRVAIDPLQQLARSAVQISASGQARIVDTDRPDEIGALARTLL